MPLKLKTPRAVLAGKFLSCKACKGQHRYESSARSRRLAVFAMLRTDVCLQALLSLPAVRAHTCGKRVVIQKKQAGCPACRGRHRAHTCGKRVR